MSEKIGTESLDLDEIIEAWTSSKKMNFSENEAKLIKAMYPPLAQGEPVAPADVATSSGFPLEMIEKSFRLNETLRGRVRRVGESNRYGTDAEANEPQICCRR